MAKIERVSAREIFDSRAHPTVEATVVLSDGSTGSSSVPSGALRGTYEVGELRDNDPARFSGRGVLSAVKTITDVIAPAISGMEAQDQQKVDRTMIELDGTQNKSKLGGNSILAVSQALAKATAKSSLLPLAVYLRQFISYKKETHQLPSPIFNMIEGGKHADNGLNFQEFLVIPATSFDFNRSLTMGIELYQAIGGFLKSTGFPTSTADESGYAPGFSSNLDVFKSLKGAIETTQYSYSKDVFLGVDAAAKSFVANRKYVIKDKSGEVGYEDLLTFYKSLISDFSLIYLEDPFAEDDWDAWKRIFQEEGGSTLIVGDDLTTTNPYRLQMALNNNVINAMVVKPTQIGTVSEALAVVEIARYKNLKVVVSSRSGETADDFIADFAVAVDADYVKFGAPAHERMIKYNRLLEIQDEITRLNSM